MAVLMREAIGGSLRRARTEGRRTLREVSRRARVSLGYLSEVERGRKEASSELLAAICEALDDLVVRRPRRGRRGHRAVAGRRRRRGPHARTAPDRAAAHGSAPRGRRAGCCADPCATRPWPRCRCAACGPPPEPPPLRSSGSPRHRPPDDPRYRRPRVEVRTAPVPRWGSQQVTHSEGGADGQRFHEGLEVPDGVVLVEGRRVRRPQGADPAGHRRGAAPAPGAVPAGRRRDRQPAPARDEAQPPAR